MDSCNKEVLTLVNPDISDSVVRILSALPSPSPTYYLLITCPTNYLEPESGFLYKGCLEEGLSGEEE